MPHLLPNMLCLHLEKKTNYFITYFINAPVFRVKGKLVLSVQITIFDLWRAHIKKIANVINDKVQDEKYKPVDISRTRESQ
jgi:hypothetical protein